MTDLLKRSKRYSFHLIVAVLMAAALWQAFEPYIFQKERIASAQQKLRMLSADDLATVVAEGKHPTLLVIGASWCTACREYGKELVKLARAGELAHVQVIMLSLDKSEAEMLRYFVLSRYDHYFMPYMATGNISDFYARVGSKLGNQLPQTIVFSPQGQLLYEFVGIAQGEAQQRMLSYFLH